MFEMALALVVCAVAGLVDLRTTEVPDMLNYSAAAAGLGLAAITSVGSHSFWPLANSVLGGLAFFGLGALFFYTGQWGGGDGKLLIALGTLLGADAAGTIAFARGLSGEPWWLGFLLNLMLVGALYGLAWSVAVGIREKEKTATELGRILLANGWIRYASMASIALGLAALFLGGIYVWLGLLAIALAAGIWISIFTKAVERGALLVQISPSELMEGDWIAKNIMVKGRNIAGPKDLGVTKAQIFRLRKLYSQKKIRKVLVKKGIPFTPVFFLALGLTALKGAVILRMLGL